MPRVPTTVQDLLNFCDEHGDVWTIAPTSVGLTAGMVTAFKAVTDTAIADVAAQLSAKEKAKSTTVTANSSVRALRQSVAGMIRAITTYASAQSNPATVYAAAQIAPPAPRTPSEPPGQPTDMTATLDTEGNITLRWRCQNPQGGNVVYSIMRRGASSETFTQVGVSGARSFTDDTIPAGSASVQYQIRGLRGQTIGPASAAFVLQFGHGGGLSFGEAKLAA